MGDKGVLAVFFLVLVAPACVTTQDLATQRASREFNCPQAGIVMRDRPDLADNGLDRVIDVRACGHVARYHCFGIKTTDCVREALDPEEISSLMSAPETAPAVVAAPPVAAPSPVFSDRRRTCRDRADFDETRNCVYVEPPALARPSR